MKSDTQVGGGFTIVETMIVLAVSSMLFIIAGTMISGRQAKTEFQVSVRDIQTKLQQVINETKSGYYGVNTGMSCSVPPSGNLTIVAGSGDLGTRGECVFIGKALVAYGDAIYTYPLAGARQVGGADVKSVKQARATVLPGSTGTYKLPYGTMLVSWAFDGSLLSNPTSAAALAIITSFSTTTNSDAGSQTFTLHSFIQPFGNRAEDFEAIINSEQGEADAFPTKQQAVLCIRSGGTDQSAKIIIGGNGGTAVHTEIKGNTTCAG